MTNQVSISEANGCVELSCPYDSALPNHAKEIGGRWNAAHKTWVFDVRDMDRVVSLASTMYGYSPESVDEPSVTVRVPVREGSTNEFRVCGRRLAWRPGRDVGVKLADDVVLVSGRFASSGGSMKNPALESEDAVLEVRDLPKSVAERFVAEAKATIVGDSSIDIAALQSERESLMTRLATIDSLLGSHG